MINLTSYTASQARKNLYQLIKSASKGLTAYEISLRGCADPVVLVNKAELESWQETLDVLGSPKEIKAIRKARKQKQLLSHQELLRSLGLK